MVIESADNKVNVQWLVRDIVSHAAKVKPVLTASSIVNNGIKLAKVSGSTKSKIESEYSSNPTCSTYSRI